MSDLGAEVESSWEACTVAGRMLRAAAMERRGERARRAMADMACWEMIIIIIIVMTVML